MPLIPFHLFSEPGIKRDGTLLEGSNYIDGQWTRWQRSLPRKMGGYRRLTNLLGGISRGLNVFTQNNETYTHSGSASVLERFTIDPNGVTSAIIDRTPVGFAADSNNQWQFDQMTDANSSLTNLIAWAGPTAADISTDTMTTVYYGDVTANSVLTTVGQQVSGGVVVAAPYLWIFGSWGVVSWSVPNTPTDFSGSGSGTARITGSKVVRGLELRGGAGNSPAVLFWTLDSLVRATFIGSPAYFQFDTISSAVSILSTNSVIEYDGIYYWVGIDQFYMFNGVVRAIPNKMNIDYFFDNLNWDAKNKVFAIKVARYGEIWWCYPRGAATECTHAVILNLNETQKSGEPVWYDTKLPNSGRSAGQWAQTFADPLMAGVDADTSTGVNKYKLWQHEFQFDELDGHSVAAIPSYFRTAELSSIAGEDILPPTNNSLICEWFEPDFVQSGDMTIQMIGRWNARSTEFLGELKTFPDNSTTLAPEYQVIPMRENARLMSFLIMSNVQGGNYEMGTPLIHITMGDQRVRS